MHCFVTTYYHQSCHTSADTLAVEKKIKKLVVYVNNSRASLLEERPIIILSDHSFRLGSPSSELIWSVVACVVPPC